MKPSMHGTVVIDVLRHLMKFMKNFWIASSRTYCFLFKKTIVRLRKYANIGEAPMAAVAWENNDHTPTFCLYCSASAMCARPMRSLPSRSAIVRATLIVRW